MTMKIPPYCRGVDDERHRNRVAAFGAIRRAAEVAREYDAIYKQALAIGDHDTYASTPDGDDVRRAIRAAIGSPKT